MQISPAVRQLLLLNIGVYFLPQLLQFFTGTEINFPELLGMRYPLADSFEPYQIFTHFFVHSGLWHLFGNMFALFVFGPMLERLWGTAYFLKFYLVCGFVAAFLYTGVNFWEISELVNDVANFKLNPSPDGFEDLLLTHLKGYNPEINNFIRAYAAAPDSPENIRAAIGFSDQIYEVISSRPMVGASGAIFGILAAFGLLFPNMELLLLFPPIPVKAKYLVSFYALYEIYSIFENAPDDNVAHYAHIGGMLFAWILIRMRRSQGKPY